MKAVIYARVSSKDQEREGFSIPAQISLLKDYATKNGFRVVATFREAETAKIAGRQEFGRMLDYISTHPDVRDILVEKTDRLYRNFKDYSRLDFEQLDIRIHLVKEAEILSKGSKSHQKFIHGIKVLMAKNYSDNLSEEVKKGQTEKAGQGIWPSCAPIGYLNRLEDHTIVPDPKVAPLIVKAFELAATGQYSINRLKREMFRHGLRSRRAGKELGKAAMTRVLRNPIYSGSFLWKGKTYRGQHEPLIDFDLYERTQAALGFQQKPRLTKRSFSFAGVLTCGHCGCAITAEEKRKKSGRTYVYYHCTNGKKACQNVVYIREERIESVFASALQEIQLTPEIVEWTRQALLESAKDESEYREASIRRLTERYSKLDDLIGKAYEDKLEGRIEPDLWERKTDEWKGEQARIEGDLKRLRDANTGYIDDGIKLMGLAQRAAELFPHMTPEEKREMLSLVLSNPRIQNGSICYDFKMPFAMFTNVVNLDKWRGRVDDFRTWCMLREARKA